MTYEDDVHPYSDLALGRVDAVLLDEVLAERGVRRNAGLFNQPTDSASATTSACSAPGNAALRDRINEILRQAMRDGRLEAIFRRWDMWNDDQPRLYARVLAGADGGARPDAVRRHRRAERMGGGACDTCRRCCAPPASRWCCRAWRCCWRWPSAC